MESSDLNNSSGTTGLSDKPGLCWYQFSLRRLMLTITSMAVYFAFLKTLKFNEAVPITIPVYLLEHPFDRGFPLGVGVCLLHGISLAAVILRPNRYTGTLLAFSTLFWLFIGYMVSMAWASC
jgi:hypothetical protein